jgi:hypothetical protein
MKKLMALLLILAAVAAAGLGAYRFGLLDRFTAAGSSGDAANASAPSTAAPTVGESTSAPIEGPTPAAPPPPSSREPAPSSAAEAAPPAASPDTPPRAPSAPPIPAGLVAVAQPGQPVSNKAIELRVTDLSTVPAVGNRKAADGRQFVVVTSSWKSLVPPQKVNRKTVQDRTAGMGRLGFGGGATAKDKTDDDANTTVEDVPFEIGPLTQKVWLIVNGSAERIDVAVTNATEGHLPPQALHLPAQNAVKSGPLVFQAPADASSFSLLVLDSVNGHLLVPIKGAAPVLAAGLGGAARSNDLVDLAVTGTSWADEAPSLPGTKTLVVSLRGISRQIAIAQIPFGSFAFLQTNQGCVAQPETRAPQLGRPLAPMGAFLPFVPSEGQLAFTVPADTQGATLLLRLRQGGSIDLPALGDGSASKPRTVATHADGTVLRVHVVGTSTPPEGLVRTRPGFEPLVVDYVVENLKTGVGLDLQPAPQFALADASGAKYPPDRASQQLPCRLTGANTVPAGGWRRFSLLYVVPAGQPLTLQYRGFASPGSLNIR